MNLAQQKEQKDKKVRRMKFGVIEDEDSYKSFVEQFERMFDCTFKTVNMTDEIFKKKLNNLSIYNNGIRVVSYPGQNEPYEIEQIMQKEYDSFHEYSYSPIVSLDDPSQLLLGIDLESMAKVEIQNGIKVDLPQFGLKVLIFKPIRKESMEIESNKAKYSVEFFFDYEVGPVSGNAGQREKIIEFEKMLEASFNKQITKYLKIDNNTKDDKGITDVQRLRPYFQ